jgi:hypothetical protein
MTTKANAQAVRTAAAIRLVPRGDGTLQRVSACMHACALLGPTEKHVGPELLSRRRQLRLLVLHQRWEDEVGQVPVDDRPLLPEQLEDRLRVLHVAPPEQVEREHLDSLRVDRPGAVEEVPVPVQPIKRHRPAREAWVAPEAASTTHSQRQHLSLFTKVEGCEWLAHTPWVSTVSRPRGYAPHAKCHTPTQSATPLTTKDKRHTFHN